MVLNPTGPALVLAAISATLLVFCWILVILRVIVRVRIRGFGLDDWLMCAGLIIFTLTAICGSLAAFNGVGMDSPHLNAYYEGQGRKWFIFFQLFYILGTVPIKASICVTIIRITNRPIYRWVLYATIVLATIACIICEAILLSFCRPIAANWDATVGGTCADPSVMTGALYYISANSILTDWTVAILPAFIMWNVHLRFRIKASVAVVLGLGVFASSATLVRLPYILSYADTDNHLYGISEIAIWSVVESGIGVIAGSLATLRPLLKYMSSQTGPGGMTGANEHLSGSYGHPLGPIRRGGVSGMKNHSNNDNDNNNNDSSISIDIGDMERGGARTTVHSSGNGGGRGRGNSSSSSSSKKDWQELRDDSDSQKFILDKGSSGSRSSRKSDGDRVKVLSPGITVTTDVTQTTMMSPVDSIMHRRCSEADDYGF